MYKDYKSGGSVITERLYIDIKQDFKNKKKRYYLPASKLLAPGQDAATYISSKHLHQPLPQISLVSTYKMVTDPETISNFLSEQREAAPEDLQQSFLTIEDFWDRKLWHQLTGVLVEYFHNPDSASQRLPLFRHFILSFSDKINQLKFVYLGLLAATQCAGRLIPINF